MDAQKPGLFKKLGFSLQNASLSQAASTHQFTDELSLIARGQQEGDVASVAYSAVNSRLSEWLLNSGAYMHWI